MSQLPVQPAWRLADCPAQQRWLWLLSDGRSREMPDAPPAADLRIVVDCENQRLPLRRCRTLAARWRARYMMLADFT